MKKENTKYIAELAVAWQRCRPENLPAVFYAYDDEECQSERVVTYRIGKGDMKRLLREVKLKKDEPGPDFHFKVHLALKQEYLTEQIPEQPAFALFIQALNAYPKKGHKPRHEDYAGSVELKWEKNSRFSKSMEDGTNSEANALSAAGAYLFIHSWMETPEENLAQPFTAISKVLGKRVSAYRFAPNESKSIYHDILSSLEGNTPALDIHLGNGLAVWEHPFSFRPVIEVKGVMENGGNKTIERISGGAVNDTGDSFYDFGGPEPPPKE